MKAAAIHLMLIAAAAVVLTPFAWLACAAFKSGPDLFSALFLPWNHLGQLTLSNFVDLFHRQPFALWLFNSIFLASSFTALSIVLCSLAGFAMAKYQFAGKGLVYLAMLATMILPAQVLVPGSYELMYRIGWIDSYLAVIVPGAASAMGIFLFRQAMLKVPDELLQSARLDGCGELRLWWEIALPMVQPMVGAFTLLCFAASWNGFLWPQIVLQDEGKFTLPIALNNLNSLPEYQQQFGIIMAATLLSIVPVAILFFALQGDLMDGLKSGQSRSKFGN